MTLPFHPEPGRLVVCDYRGFQAPEMTKTRLAIVISPKLKRRDGLATVVPLSATYPDPLCEWHLPLLIDVPDPWGHVDRWAKCDMVNTVAYDRLNLPYSRHPVTGARVRFQLVVEPPAVEALRRCVAAALGITPLLK